MTRARDLAAFVSNADGDIKFDTDTLFIDSSANKVGIGLNNPEKRVHIFDSTQTNQSIRFGNPSATPYGEINYNSTGSEHLYITSKGTTSGYGNIVFQVGGTPSEAMRILSTGGITFNGDTAAANALDDYEEGSHAATFGMNTSGSLSMLRQNLGYVKIGRLVTVTGEVTVSSVSSPVGSMTMSLPFTISANGTGRDTFMGSKPVAYHVPHHQDNTPVILGNNNAASVTFVYEQDDAAFASYTPAANDTFNISFSYMTT